jgi:hypothetical protein
MVGSGTRNARAISVVVNPPRSRSVSATWAGTASAGWHQVKIRRRRSSRTGPSSTGSPGSAAARPPASADGLGEGVLDRLLGDVHVPEAADQDGHRPAVLLSEGTRDLRRGYGGHAPPCWKGRTSMGRVVARAAFRAQSSAASRSGASMIQSPPTCSLPSV